MKAFNFRLESVLSLRRAEEDAARRAFAGARRAAALQAADLSSLQADERRAKSDLLDAQNAPSLSVASLLAHQRHLLALGRRVLASRHKLAELEAAVAAARTKLVASSKNRKTLDTLRDHKLDAWRLDVLREEQKDLDETAQRRALENRP